MAAQSSPSRPARFQAMASRVEHPAQGSWAAQARPLAVATPMRSPVKDPGPAATAMRSKSATVRPQWASSSSVMGRRVWLWVKPVSRKDWAIRASSSHRATEAAVAEDSSARIFMGAPPPLS